LAKVLLEMKNITKTFPGVKALDNVNLKVEEGGRGAAKAAYSPTQLGKLY